MTRTGLLIAVALATAAPAFAQLPPGRAARPSRTSFGSVKPASERLTIGVSFGAGYEDDLTEPIPGAPPVRSGEFASAITNLGYVVDKDTVRGDLSFGAAVRYYGDGGLPVSIYNGGGSVTVALSKKASMTGTAHAGSYLDTAAIFGGDAYSSNPFTSQTPLVPISDVFQDGSTYNSLYGSVQVGYQMNDRVTMNGAYGYYSNNAFSGASSLYGAQTASGGISYSLGKGFGLRAGYGYTGSGFGNTTGGAPVYSGHSFDGGVTYGQSLSVSRRSSLSFSTSLSSVTDQNRNTRVFAGGTASFQYEIGRSWDAGVHYSRGVDFFQMLGQPTFSDQVDATLGGGIGRKVQVSGNVALIRGTVGVASGSPTYDSASASGGMRVGFTRYLGLSVNYAYYRYQYDSSIALPPGLVNSRQSQVVRVSFDVWAPLYERARRANATR